MQQATWRFAGQHDETLTSGGGEPWPDRCGLGSFRRFRTLQTPLQRVEPGQPTMTSSAVHPLSLYETTRLMIQPTVFHLLPP